MRLSLFTSDHVQFSQIVEYIDKDRYPSLEEVITFKGKKYRFIVRGNNKASIEVDGKYFTVGRFEETENISKEYKMYTLVREFFFNFPLDEMTFPLFNGALEKYDIKFVATEQFVKTKGTFTQPAKPQKFTEYIKVVEEATEEAREHMQEYYDKINAAKKQLFGEL
jgi:hypothetical protein